MATLIELSDDITTTGCSLTIVDYDVVFHLCRKGIWVGSRCQQRQRVVLSYEHDPEVLYVGWSINGTTVLDPGYGTFTPPWGAPAPGTPDVTYETGVDSFAHRIALRVEPGTPAREVQVRVLYRGPAEASQPAHLGPGTTVSLNGVAVHWPKVKLQEERRCWENLLNLLRRYVKVRRPGPGDPVERALERVQNPEDMVVLAAARAVAELDPKADAELIEQYGREVSALVTRLTLGHMPGEIAERPK
jgi:hypothetical protein